MSNVIDRQRVQQLVQQGARLVDVLGAREYEAEHIPGAISIPLKTLNRATTKPLDRRTAVITYCHDYQWDMSARAASRLASLGFTMVFRYQAGKAGSRPGFPARAETPTSRACQTAPIATWRPAG